jgi:hypothetical protein
MKENFGRCAEQLRHTVRYLAQSSSSPREKLTGLQTDTEFGEIYQLAFPVGSLRDEYLAISASLIKANEPQDGSNIAAISDEQACELIEPICTLSVGVAYALGRQSNSA